jgi:hypothetical protein
MLQRRTPAGKRPFESRIIHVDGFARRRAPQPMRVSAAEGHSRAANWSCSGVVSLLPAAMLLSPAILVVLLAIFVVWLAVFGLLGAAIVVSDVLRGAVWRPRLPIGARAAGYPAGP